MELVLSISTFDQIVLAVAIRCHLAKLQLQVVHEENYTWKSEGRRCNLAQTKFFFSQIKIIFKLKILSFLNRKIVLIKFCYFT